MMASIKVYLCQPCQRLSFVEDPSFRSESWRNCQMQYYTRNVGAGAEDGLTFPASSLGNPEREKKKERKILEEIDAT